MAKRRHGSATSRMSVSTWLATCVLSTITALPAAAQTPPRDMPRGLGDGGAFGGIVDRATTIDSQGLNNPMLRLTTAQRAEIDQLVDAYQEEQKKLNDKFSKAQSAQASQEAISARKTARANLTTALATVMNSEQRKTWEAAQAARHSPGNRSAGANGGGLRPGGN